MIIWLVWNFLEQKDPLSFGRGPYSTGMETLVTSFANHMHLNPVGSFSMILEVSKAMYGVPVLLLSIVGVLMYFYINRVRKSISIQCIIANYVAHSHTK